LQKGWASHEANPTESKAFSTESRAYMIMLFDQTSRVEAADAFNLMNAHFNGGVGHGYEHRKSIKQIKSFFGTEARRRKNPTKPKSKAELASKYYAAASTLKAAKQQHKHMNAAAALWHGMWMKPMMQAIKDKQKAEKLREKAEKLREKAENQRLRERRKEDLAFEKAAKAMEKELNLEKAASGPKKSKKRARPIVDVVVELQHVQAVEDANPYQKQYSNRTGSRRSN
jgi:hypothetical protein